MSNEPVSWSIQSKMRAGFALLTLILIFVLILTQYSSGLAREASGWMNHALRVLTELQGVLGSLTESETGMRGYLITGDKAFLGSLGSAEARVNSKLDSLHRLTLEDPLQNERVQSLRVAATRVLATRRRTIETASRQGIEAARSLVADGGGEKAMDEIRARIVAIQREESGLQRQREERAASTAQYALATLSSLGALIFLLLLSGYAILGHHLEERNRAEKAAEMARAYAESIVDSVQTPLLALDWELRVKSVNEAYLEAFGQSKPDVESKPFFQLGNGLWDLPPLQTGLARMREDGAPMEDVEIRVAIAGQAPRVLLFNGRPFKVPRGFMSLLLVSFLDITRRRQAELALKNYAEEIYDLYNDAPCGYHSLDTEGRITRVNQTEARWLGYDSAEELVGKVRFRDLLTPASRAAFDASLPRLAASGAADGIELEVVRKDGTLLPVVLNTSAVRGANGEIGETRTTLFDNTEQKQALEKIRELNAALALRAELVEASNKELEAFSYSVSHDLRAPLRHIDGFADLLRKRSGAALDEKGIRFLDTISQSAKKMGQLIDDLLVFSRMGRSDVRRANVPLRRLVDDSIRELQPDTQGRNIQWRIAELPELWADSAMLKQVVQNLLANAVKYTGPRPEAVIEIGSAEGPDGQIAVFVRDNGVGFDMQYVDKLFGVFQRLHRNDEFEGTGIGLANVRRIVLRHGGKTWADGKVGVGACFWFSLPKPPAPPRHSPSEAPEATPAAQQA